MDFPYEISLASLGRLWKKRSALVNGHVYVNISWRLGMSSSSESSHPPKALSFPESCRAPSVAWLELNGKMGCRSGPPTCQVQIPPQITPNAWSGWVCSTECPPGHMLCCAGVPHAAVQPTSNGYVGSKQCFNAGRDGFVPGAWIQGEVSCWHRLDPECCPKAEAHKRQLLCSLGASKQMECASRAQGVGSTL